MKIFKSLRQADAKPVYCFMGVRKSYFFIKDKDGYILTDEKVKYQDSNVSSIEDWERTMLHSMILDDHKFPELKLLFNGFMERKQLYVVYDNNMVELAAMFPPKWGKNGKSLEEAIMNIRDNGFSKDAILSLRKAILNCYTDEKATKWSVKLLGSDYVVINAKNNIEEKIIFLVLK